MNWENGGSNHIPKDVLAIEFSFESFERIRKCYNTFDSISARGPHNQISLTSPVKEK